MTFHDHHAPQSAVSSPAVRQPGPVTRAIRGLRPNEAPTWEQRQREIAAEEREAMRALRRRVAEAVTVAIDFLDAIAGLPPHRSSVPCRPGDPPPARTPLPLATPALAEGQEVRRGAALR